MLPAFFCVCAVTDLLRVVVEDPQLAQAAGTTLGLSILSHQDWIRRNSNIELKPTHVCGERASTSAITVPHCRASHLLILLALRAFVTFKAIVAIWCDKYTRFCANCLGELCKLFNCFTSQNARSMNICQCYSNFRDCSSWIWIWERNLKGPEDYCGKMVPPWTLL